MSEKKENITDVPAITLPADQYAHTGAPTEWWWHVGTLQSSDGRTFGFEINATGEVENGLSFAFTQIEITDVQNKCNYQKVAAVSPCPPNWAEYDNTQPWYVNLDPNQDSNGAISMQSINGNPLNMAVQATFIDAPTGTPCSLNINLYQQGAPLLVWGTGWRLVNPSGTSPITKNNYYYSLTHLQASGTIKIGDETIEVTGLIPTL